MVVAARYPSGVDLVEVSDIERVERSALNRGQTEVVFILSADHTRVRGSDYVDSTGPKTPNNIAVHRILVYVQTKPARSRYVRAGNISSTAASSAAMSLSISSRLAW
jgi:hypothetical protein